MKMNTEMAKNVVEWIHAGIKPALGCTEPGAVALAAAYAGKELGEGPVTRIEITVDPNVYKNGVAVGVPGTGRVGLEIAAALGALIREPSLELSVLRSITPELLTLAEKLLASGNVKVSLKDRQGLYVGVTVFSGDRYARALLEGGHTHLTHLSCNGESLLQGENESGVSAEVQPEWDQVTLAGLIDAVVSLSTDELVFFEECICMNTAAARSGMEKRLGMAIGATFQELIRDKLLTDDLINSAKIQTAAAADARMSGENIPVMSVAGSGNHGLTAILPVVSAAERLNIPREKLYRALAVSAVTTLYIKRFTGNLSALCGCAVAAATGACAGIVWMMGGSHAQIAAAVKNMIANLTGMICDGGKVGCALKLSAAAGVAVETALLSMKNVLVPETNGIIFASVDDTIRNLGRVSNPGMLETDKVIIEIMREKGNQAMNPAAS